MTRVKFSSLLGVKRKLYSSSEVDDRIQNLIDIGPAKVRNSRISDYGKWLLYIVTKVATLKHSSDLGRM